SWHFFFRNEHCLLGSQGSGSVCDKVKRLKWRAENHRTSFTATNEPIKKPLPSRDSVHFHLTESRLLPVAKERFFRYACG
ncbi:hypothetical protein, partial [Enterococcus innesii]|uniref:hypothetical protein n=1 Tax=Enterococcus innesii TaxID=2839759 RepID=UPI003F829D43